MGITSICAACRRSRSLPDQALSDKTERQSTTRPADPEPDHPALAHATPARATTCYKELPMSNPKASESRRSGAGEQSFV